LKNSYIAFISSSFPLSIPGSSTLLSEHPLEKHIMAITPNSLPSRIQTISTRSSTSKQNGDGQRPVLNVDTSNSAGDMSRGDPPSPPPNPPPSPVWMITLEDEIFSSSDN
jgi:hypothetical protein